MTRQSTNAIIPYTKSVFSNPFISYLAYEGLRQVPGITRAAFNSGGKQIQNWLQNQSTTTPSAVNYSIPNGMLTNPLNKVVGKSKRQGRGRRKNRSGVPRTLRIAPGDNLPVNFKTLIPITTLTTTGIVGAHIGFCYKSALTAASAGNFDIGQVGTVFAGLCNIYQYVTYKRAKVTYIPQVASTTAGSLAICFESNFANLVSVPNSYISAVERRNGVLTDVKLPCVFVWTPDNEQEREAKLTNDSSGSSFSAGTAGNIRAYMPGALKYYTSTNLTSSATTIGQFMIEMDVVFSELI